jgi:hypothetical protein
MSQLGTGALTFRIRGPKDRSQAVDGAPLLVPSEVGDADRCAGFQRQVRRSGVVHCVRVSVPVLGARRCHRRATSEAAAGDNERLLGSDRRRREDNFDRWEFSG